jgi:hypothetical protein
MNDTDRLAVPFVNFLWDHVPAASTTQSDESYLDCSCGWDEDASMGWMAHIEAALAGVTLATPAPLDVMCAARAVIETADCYGRPYLPSPVWVKVEALRAAIAAAYAEETP